MYASIKYDGFRGLLLNDNFYSPVAKPFGNQNLPLYFADLIRLAMDYQLVLDGEVWSETLSFSDLSSVLRRHKGDLSLVQYHIFDVLTIDEWNHTKRTRYVDRYAKLHAFGPLLPDNCRIVQQNTCLNAEVAQAMYGRFLAAGHEGVILRSPTGLYKNNRCTHNESNCFKFKHFQTTDAKIVDVIQRRKLKDSIDRTYSPYGLLDKVNTQDSYDLDDAVGAFQVRLADGRITSVNLGRGFSYLDRREMWIKRDGLIGKTIEFKWMPHGTKDLPRIGSVTRFRPDKD